MLPVSRSFDHRNVTSPSLRGMGTQRVFGRLGSPVINVPNGGEMAVARVVNLLERGARHHTLGVRGFFFGIPLALWLFGPLWMLSSALVLVILLYRLDHHLG